MPARVMFTSGRKIRAADKYCTMEGQGPIGPLKGLVYDVETRLHPRHEAKRGHRERFSLRRLERLGGDVESVVLEAHAVDVRDVRVALRDLVLDALDALVQVIQNIGYDVLGVARELQPKVSAPHVHAHLLARLLHVPLGDANPGFGGAHPRFDLAEGVDGNGPGDVEVHRRLEVTQRPGGDVFRAELALCIDDRAGDGGQQRETARGSPLEPWQPLRLFELPVSQGKARSGRP